MINEQTKTKKLLLIGGAFFLTAAILFLKSTDKGLSFFDGLTEKPVKTTSPEIAIGNLEAQIKSVSNLLKKSPENLNHVSKIMDLVLTKTVFMGNYSDFKMLEQYVKSDSQIEDQIDINFDFYLATHQFDRAERELQKLRTANKNNVKATSFDISLKLARGESLKDIKIEQEKALKKRRSFSNLIKMSAIQSELGEFAQADNSLKEALENYKDTSPFPHALVYFQRGVLWGEKIGDANKAKKFYEKAVHHLPQHSSAQVHLAEILFEEGKTDKALAALENVISNGDPEPKGLKYEILESLNKSELAKDNLTKANAEYQDLLKNFKDAFSDHGAEFYMGPGNQPAKAAELALDNLKNRKNQRSYKLALEALSLNKNKVQMCDLLSKAKTDLTINHAPLIEVVSSLKGRCDS
jgi:tetratricopeptide (TPR) repeat protein